MIFSWHHPPLQDAGGAQRRGAGEIKMCDLVPIRRDQPRAGAEPAVAHPEIHQWPDWIVHIKHVAPVLPDLEYLVGDRVEIVRQKHWQAVGRLVASGVIGCRRKFKDLRLNVWQIADRD